MAIFDIEVMRVGIDILEQKEVDDTYIVPDATLQAFIDDAIVFVGTSDITLPSDIKKVAIKYLAQHLYLMNQKDTSSISLPNNSESWNARVSGLGLDQTTQGQAFKDLLRPFTDDFESADDLSKKPQHGLKIFS